MNAAINIASKTGLDSLKLQNCTVTVEYLHMICWVHIYNIYMQGSRTDRRDLNLIEETHDY